MQVQLVAQRKYACILFCGDNWTYRAYARQRHGATRNGAVHGGALWLSTGLIGRMPDSDMEQRGMELCMAVPCGCPPDL